MEWLRTRRQINARGSLAYKVEANWTDPTALQTGLLKIMTDLDVLLSFRLMKSIVDVSFGVSEFCCEQCALLSREQFFDRFPCARRQYIYDVEMRRRSSVFLLSRVSSQMKVVEKRVKLSAAGQDLPLSSLEEPIVRQTPSL